MPEKWLLAGVALTSAGYAVYEYRNSPRIRIHCLICLFLSVALAVWLVGSNSVLQQSGVTLRALKYHVLKDALEIAVWEWGILCGLILLQLVAVISLMFRAEPDVTLDLPGSDVPVD